MQTSNLSLQGVNILLQVSRQPVFETPFWLSNIQKQFRIFIRCSDLDELRDECIICLQPIPLREMRVALNKRMKGNPKRTKARAKSKKCNTSSYILRNLGTTVCGTHPFTLQTK